MSPPTGRNQIGRPRSSTIIGPSCPGPRLTARKIDPRAAPSAAGVATVSVSGSRRGREWNCFGAIGIGSAGAGASGSDSCQATAPAATSANPTTPSPMRVRLGARGGGGAGDSVGVPVTVMRSAVCPPRLSGG